jgi:acetyl esterase/lipase
VEVIAGRRHFRFASIIAALVALAVLAGCTLPAPPGAFPLRYRDTVFSSATVTRDLQYGSAPGLTGLPQALRLDLYQPTGDTQSFRPALVWVHGGGFASGDKASGMAPDIANRFAKLGYVVVSINYRLLSPTGCTGTGGLSAACIVAALEAKHDAQAAVRWLRSKVTTYRIDPFRIGIGGESAGGITAALVGMFSEDVGTSGNPGFSSKVGGWVSLSGGLPNGLFASAGDAPGLLFHGTADPVVPYTWSSQTAAALLSAGVPAIYQGLEGAGHVPWLQYQTQIFTQSDYFFYAFLDLAHAAGQPAAAAEAFEAQAEKLADKYPRYARPLQKKYEALSR